MNYTITRSTLTEAIIDEVSRVAAHAYSEQGEALYDGIRITSGDIPQVEKLEDEAITSLLKRTSDICSQSQADPLALTFDVPDFDANSTTTVTGLLDRYLTLAVCAGWMKVRYSTEAEGYGAAAVAALEKAVALLKTRKALTRRY